MSAPTTYVDAIERIRELMAANMQVHSGLCEAIKDTRYSVSERETCEAFNIMLNHNVEQLQELSVGLAQLAMANSKEDFDKIIAAVAK